MTRLLTKIEIEDIISFVKPQPDIPQETAMSVVNVIKERFRKQLRKQQVYSIIIPALKQQLEQEYQKTLIQPGESVGISLAQGVGEKNTQMTLNTFHRAGQSEKAMTAGVPRFQELLNATKDPKIVNCKIYLNGLNDTLQQTRETIGHTLVGLTFEDICESMVVCMDKEEESWYSAAGLLYDDEFLKYDHCVSIKVKMTKLYEYRLTLEQIADFVHEEFGDLFCVFSPPQNGQLDIFVDISNISLPENRMLFIDTDNASEVYLEECVLTGLEKTFICGIQKVSEIYYSQENGEWVVETNGCDFKSILAHPNVDETRTFSNDVWDIYETLGIEAARQFLIEEFMSIMEGINMRHTELLVDRMTHAGTINSISRYTLRKDEAGPFGKASFEETMDNFLNAAAHGDIETTKGVSASIICGKRANIGTGMVKLRIDIEHLPNAVHVLEDRVVERTFKKSRERKKKPKKIESDEDDDCIPNFVEV